MRIIITGGTGLVGSDLARYFAEAGHEVIVLSRTPDKKAGAVPAGAQVVGWDGRTAEGWGHLADGADAILNLAGYSIGGTRFPPPRWTPDRKRLILESRVDAGQAVVAAIEAAQNKPRILIQASAVGYYGPHDDEIIMENDPPGTDWLAGVTVTWEKVTEPVEALGVRRVVMRQGIYLDPRNNALNSLLLQSKLMAGGPLGSGNQYMPWIHPADTRRAVEYFIATESARGAYNLVAPQTITNREIAKAVGRVMKRPAFLPTPAFALKIALGEVSAVVLDGQRVVPEHLRAEGFEWRYPEFELALRDVLGK